MDVNLKNVALKAFWTAVSAVLGYGLVYVADIQPAPGWSLLAITGINYVLAYVREQLGETTPDLPPA